MTFVLHDVETGLFVQSYDPDWQPNPARPQYPCGLVTWTETPTEAMKFVSFTAAIECWRSTSATFPLRPDGQPNRPLTARPLIEVYSIPG